jgi:hypothetical protein
VLFANYKECGARRGALNAGSRHYRPELAADWRVSRRLPAIFDAMQRVTE